VLSVECVGTFLRLRPRVERRQGRSAFSASPSIESSSIAPLPAIKPTLSTLNPAPENLFSRRNPSILTPFPTSEAVDLDLDSVPGSGACPLSPSLLRPNVQGWSLEHPLSFTRCPLPRLQAGCSQDPT